MPAFFESLYYGSRFPGADHLRVPYRLAILAEGEKVMRGGGARVARQAEKSVKSAAFFFMLGIPKRRKNP
jgi:hypothetical protein